MAEDAAAYFERLTDILFRYGFGWVVDQAEAEILEGKSVTKEVRVVEYLDPVDADSFERRPQRRRQASLMTTVPFDDAERLRILLHAIQAALSQRSALERAILAGLEGVGEIEFVPEDRGGGIEGARTRRKPLRLERDRLGEGAYLEETVDRILREVREDIDVRS